MTVLSNKRADVIQFFTQRLAGWQANAAQIGLDPTQVTELSGLTATASSSYQEALTQRQNSKDATHSFYEDTDALRDFGAALIATIKAFAEATNDAGVYALASIPEPADPTPSAPPATPAITRLFMRTTGAVEIGWDGSVAGGTFYEVRRSLDDGNTWTSIASLPAREAVDDAVPQGTARVYYQVRGVKGAAGAGSPDRTPRFSEWTPAMVVFLGKPGNQQQGQQAAA